MAARRVDALLLTDSNGFLCGILTDKDITTRVIARELKMEKTPVSKVMTRNPVFVLVDRLVVEALQKMVQGKFRHLPVVENGEVIAMLDIARCLYDVIALMERAPEKGKAIAAAVEGVEKHWRASVPGPNNFSRVVTVAPSDTVLTASKKMLELRVSSAVVAIESKPGGILTSRDILMRVIAQNLPPKSTTVEKVMTQSPECATVDTSILNALHTMHDGKFLHLPVLDRDGNIVTVVDVLYITHAAIATVGNSGAAGSEATSAMSIGPIDDDDDSRSPIDDDDSKRYVELNILEHIVSESEEPRHLDLALLQSITENFSEKNKIGSGGCGIVYKGILRNGIVAVKRLLNIRTIKENMFHREVISLISAKHQNIVRFLGYCSFTEEHAIQSGGRTILADIRERLLYFEYIRNGSLEKYLTDELRGLEWQSRYQIIIGIYGGIHYLHKDKGIIHMDLKPGNILLDDLMVPKITDFGLSRPDDYSKATTTLLISQGYAAPEYILGSKATKKSDIYRLGVIIIELVTGSRTKPNITKVRQMI